MRFVHGTSHLTKAMQLVAFVMAMCTFTIGANAQAVFEGKFTLPYEVTWSNSVLPAGKYVIRMDSAYNAPMISSADGRRSIYAGFPVVGDSTNRGSSLLITVNGHQHIVSSLNLPTMGFSLTFKPISRSEREALAKAGQLDSVPVSVAKK